MGARITLGSGLTASANGSSVRVRLADPPFLFVAPNLGTDGVAWTGSITIQQCWDTAPLPNDGGGVTNGGVTDANASWTTVGTLASGGDSFNWDYPLYRVRAQTSGITGGTPRVYMVENIRSLSKKAVFVDED